MLNDSYPVIYTAHAARLVRQERLNGYPFIVGEFVAHDSRPPFGSLNHGLPAELNFCFGDRYAAESGNLMPEAAFLGCDTYTFQRGIRLPALCAGIRLPTLTGGPGAGTHQGD